jgi:methylmalonyl-CoA mutase C-terminal domain/subunit
MHYFPEVIAGLKARGGEDILVFGGGIIPNQDIDNLKALGVGAVFTPGTSTQAVVEYLREAVAARRGP